MNAAECLSWAERCGRDFRDLTLAIAESWLALARHQVALDELLAIWSKSHSPQVDRTPLHYAADGNPGSSRWDPDSQSATIALLIASGADPNAIDQNGVTPLHRAVRTRCAAAASARLDGGADARRKNGNGSTPMMLAMRQTGRGGSGSPEAQTQQAEIIRLLERHGMTP
jgi:Ankyrin repeats (many copies)